MRFFDIALAPSILEVGQIIRAYGRALHLLEKGRLVDWAVGLLCQFMLKSIDGPCDDRLRRRLLEGPLDLGFDTWREGMKPIPAGMLLRWGYLGFDDDFASRLREHQDPSTVDALEAAFREDAYQQRLRIGAGVDADSGPDSDSGSETDLE